MELRTSPQGANWVKEVMTQPNSPKGQPNRRSLIMAAGALAASPASALDSTTGPAIHRAKKRPVMVGSANALRGMKTQYPRLLQGLEPLDAAIEVVKVVEADPTDMSVGKGGMPDEDGTVTLDAAVMHGPTHNSGAVGALEDTTHAVEVARLVMERTDHCMLVAQGATRFAREYGFPKEELLTKEARAVWLAWKESMSSRDDRLAPKKPQKQGKLYNYMGQKWTLEQLISDHRITGTIHCSSLSLKGEIACCTTTSGLSFKIPGRVGDSPIIGAGLYCDQEVGSAGGTGRGESAILSCASFLCVELLRSGMAPLEAGLEVLRRVTSQAQRASAWQKEMVREDGLPAFNLQLYLLGLDGSHAGVALFGGGGYAVADDQGVRLENIVNLHAK